ncbi:MAG: M50 family metallopeptidase, partial [Thermoanaerobaculia bacterium]|nr:M50 family metallopeptidase [Thermoanaerobaculia bacterium]
VRNGQQQVITLPEDAATQITSRKVAKSNLMEPRIPFYIDSLVPGQPAEKSGLQKGDRIIAFNGQAIPFYDQFSPLAKQNKDKTVELTALRGDDTVRINIGISSEGTIGVSRRIEGMFKIEREYYSFARAMPAGVTMGLEFLDDQRKAFGQMFAGNISVKDNLGSVISIGKMYGTYWDWERFWTITASLSILLAFMNLLPIPALDGGYVMFLIWEVITGRKVSDKVMEKAFSRDYFKRNELFRILRYPHFFSGGRTRPAPHFIPKQQKIPPGFSHAGR